MTPPREALPYLGLLGQLQRRIYIYYSTDRIYPFFLIDVIETDGSAISRRIYVICTLRERELE